MREVDWCIIDLEVKFSNGDEVKWGLNRISPEIGRELLGVLHKHNIPSPPASPGPDKTTA